MYLDAFDRGIFDFLKVEGKPMTLAELVEATGFARSTLITHLERLCSERLVFREKKLREGRGRSKFQYRLAESLPRAVSAVVEALREVGACRLR